MPGFEISGDIEARLRESWQPLTERIGQQVEDAARLHCPRDTGSLADSIEHHAEGGDIIVSASGNDERSYARWVEMGHRTTAGGYVPAEPFLRPAIYQELKP